MTHLDAAAGQTLRLVVVVDEADGVAARQNILMTRGANVQSAAAEGTSVGLEHAPEIKWNTLLYDNSLGHHYKQNSYQTT